jgi:hypothetical protein
MEDPGLHDDERLLFASLLEPGETLTLARADGPLVEVLVTAVDTVDVDLRVRADELPVGSLAAVRIHSGDAAWFATMIVVESEGDLVKARVGDALRVTSERWTERVELGCAAVIRPETGLDAVIRGECLNASLTGVALRVFGEPPTAGAAVGVTLTGAGDGSIAFRGRVARVGRASHGAILGVEMIGISRDDHRRLAAAIARAAGRT